MKLPLEFALCLVVLATGCKGTDDYKNWLSVRKFYAIEAVTVFPAKIGDDGHSIGRVCGPPLTASEPGAEEANGFEVTANFASASLVAPACADDHDLSVKEGELVELEHFLADSTAGSTFFQFQQRCVTDPRDTSPCTAAAQILPASAVQYRNIADRCDPGREDTRINLAFLIDNSGSMKGNIDATTLKEDADGSFDPLPAPLTNVASDWDGLRFNAIEDFIASLNSDDRVIGYLFDETGPQVAASDSFICFGTNDAAFDNNSCRPEDAKTCPAPGSCDTDPSQTHDSYQDAGKEGAQCLAFSSDSAKRTDLNNGLELKRNGANGRSSLWQAVATAFDFLTTGNETCPHGALGAMHIVVITDGPDTCVDSDDFSYQSLRNKDTTGICRVKCANSTVNWRDLLLKMAKANYPVHVHFIQFQAPGYVEPDPQQMEMACRTEGTYQFIRSENFDKYQQQYEIGRALTRAVNRVRNGLSGTWRVGFKSPAQMAKGAWMAVNGDFVFGNSAFKSLDPAVHLLSPDSWRFTTSGPDDRRALMRTACTSDADCSGTNSCSAEHCADGGICQASPAPNGRPCPGGTCRNGACMVGQKCADAIKQ
jgi:hypothetical protein